MTEELDPIAERLKVERPVPRPAFRGDLRRRILTEFRPQLDRPPRLRPLIVAYTSSGLLLFAIAIAGLAGLGPLAA